MNHHTIQKVIIILTLFTVPMASACGNSKLDEEIISALGDEHLDEIDDMPEIADAPKVVTTEEERLNIDEVIDNVETVAPAKEIEDIEESSDEESDFAIQLDALYKIYTFSLDGVNYTLPCKVQALLDAGFVFQYGHHPTDMLDPMSYLAEQLGDTEDSSAPNQRESIKVDIYNSTDHALPFSDCMIASIQIGSVSYDTGRPELPLKTSLGISLGDSMNIVREAYGTPEYESDTKLQYRFLGTNKELISLQGNGQDGMQFTFDENGTLRQMKLELVLFLD